MSDGTHYENEAAQALQRSGLEIVQRNFRCKLGEIDLICRDGERLVFVEVRRRSNRHFATAAASVTRRKQLRIIRAAQLYLQQTVGANSTPCRFDVVAFEVNGMQWLKNAFTM